MVKKRGRKEEIKSGNIYILYTNISYMTDRLTDKIDNALGAHW